MAKMKSLGRSEDIKTTQKAMEQAQSFFIGIPDKRTPWYLLGLDYVDGYVHWYDTGGQARRIVCAGGLEGKGFATDDCPICAHVLGLYQEAKRYKEEGDDAKAKQLKDRANRLHGKAEVQFKAIRGQRTLLKTPKGKEWIADWDMEEEDSNAAVGIMSLSESQFDGLTEMIKGENTPFIQEGDDLGKRVLWTAKEKRKGKTGGKYSAVVWDADEDETDIPEVEVDQELLDVDLAENFIIDLEEVEKVYELISGQSNDVPEEDEEVELEDDSEEGEFEDSDLDDLEEDGDPEEEDEDLLEDEKDEMEFEDDLPYEEEEEEVPPPKKTVKKTGTKKAGVSKKSGTVVKGKTRTTGTKKAGSKKSGKTRM